MKSQKSAHLSVIIIGILFFFSGVAALIYEVTWARKLSLVFGTDTYAVATVIAVFFAGLALGSFLFGKLVDQRADTLNPLFLYGLLELGIGVYAVATPWIFKLIEGLQVSFWRTFEPSFGGFSLFAFVLSVLALIIPTIFMGGTLPAVVKTATLINADRKRISADKKVGGVAGGLYAVNTAGAVLGVFAAGFLLIAALGVNETIWLAAVISVLVGVIAIWLSRISTDIGAHPRRADKQSLPLLGKHGYISAHQRSILLAFGLAGFAAIALEVLWTRVLIMVVGGSVYAFSLVLIAFLVGISAGSAVMARFTNRLQNVLIWFAGVEMLLGISVILLIPVFGNLPFWFLSVFKTYGSSFGGLQFGLWLMAVSVMLVPTFLMGAAFPIVVQAYRQRGVGEKMGRVYAANTVGGVFGAIVAGFLLIPTIGVQKAIFSAGAIYLLIGVWMFYASGVRTSIKVASIVTLLVFLFIGFRLAPWDSYVFSSGFYVDPSAYSGQARKDILRAISRDEILYEADGISANVAVRRDKGGTLNLRINGKADASTGADMENQLLLGHLPLFLHKDPKDVLVIGLGSGITLGSVLSHPVERVDAIEIERKVVEAARYFNEYSNNALDDDRVNLIVGDGRHFLSATDKKYDVISSEPSNAWISGSSKLFTKEYFELLKKGLRDDGIVVHWVHLYSQDLESFKSIIAAYRQVFPQVIAFGMPASNDLALIGANQPIAFDYSLLSKRLRSKEVATDLAKVGIKDPYEVLAYFVLDKEAVEKLAGDAVPNTDNNPIVEFSAPKFLYSPVAINPWRVILENLSPISSILENSRISADKAESFRRSRLLTQINFIERNIGEGIEEGERALAIDGNNPFLAETVARLYFEEGSSFLNQGAYLKAIKSFERSLELKKTPETYVNLGLSHEELGNLQRAKEALEAAVRIDDEFEIAYFELGRICEQLGDLNCAIDAYRRVAELAPENGQAYLLLGNLYLLRSDFGKAEEYLNRALKLDPELEEARELLKVIP